ncbi:MAG TPA: hypothetical protein VF950_20385 [Planctomycetota bacterium]
MAERDDDLRFYDALRSRLEHEDGLIVHRLSWFMASQSFLFTAYAIALNGPAAAARLLRLVPLVGILIAMLTFAGILAALKAMAWIRASFAARGVTEAALGLPDLLTPAPIRRFGLLGPVLLPPLFILAWAWLILR